MLISSEYHITLLLNGRPCLSVACSGSDLEMLAVGHMITEGIILSKDEIKAIQVDEERKTVNVLLVDNADVFGRLIKIRTLVSGCAGSGSESSEDVPVRRDLPRVNPAVITSAMHEFLGLSEIHSKTHGVHSAALYAVDGTRVVFFDEIGRHNAVDKVIGFAMTHGVSLDRMMLFSTGRIATEIALKAARAGIPVLVTRASPTSMAVDFVRKKNIILITGVRKDAFYVHNGAEYVG
ncbi:MAG: formate dehydrogenase accessory sulfurtransferase FdhD [Spirochaetes bacterium]|nr:formate dehydrogenase accessory sulfurtransferase FdhD [Spirochaetota bacterium]